MRHSINPAYLVGWGDLPKGGVPGPKQRVKFHAMDERPHVSVPRVSILHADLEVTETDYRVGVRALREAGL